jgi:hypothetical protein
MSRHSSRSSSKTHKTSDSSRRHSSLSSLSSRSTSSSLGSHAAVSGPTTAYYSSNTAAVPFPGIGPSTPVYPILATTANGMTIGIGGDGGGSSSSVTTASVSASSMAPSIVVPTLSTGSATSSLLLSSNLGGERSVWQSIQANSPWLPTAALSSSSPFVPSAVTMPVAISTASAISAGSGSIPLTSTTQIQPTSSSKLSSQPAHPRQGSTATAVDASSKLVAPSTETVSLAETFDSWPTDVQHLLQTVSSHGLETNLKLASLTDERHKFLHWWRDQERRLETWHRDESQLPLSQSPILVLCIECNTYMRNAWKDELKSRRLTILDHVYQHESTIVGSLDKLSESLSIMSSSHSRFQSSTATGLPISSTAIDPMASKHASERNWLLVIRVDDHLRSQYDFHLLDWLLDCPSLVRIWSMAWKSLWQAFRKRFQWSCPVVSSSSSAGTTSNQRSTALYAPWIESVDGWVRSDAACELLFRRLTHQTVQQWMLLWEMLPGVSKHSSLKLVIIRELLEIMPFIFAQTIQAVLFRYRRDHPAWLLDALI